jgi:transcriptional regulator with XRE-family HTH domain
VKKGAQWAPKGRFRWGKPKLSAIALSARSPLEAREDASAARRNPSNTSLIFGNGLLAKQKRTWPAWVIGTRIGGRGRFGTPRRRPGAQLQRAALHDRGRQCLKCCMSLTPAAESTLAVHEHRLPHKHTEIRLRTRAVDSHVGSRIRHLRLSMGLTQSDLAEIAASRFNQIHKIETGQNQISASRLYLIACALGVSIDYFFDGQRGEAEQIKGARRMREFRRDVRRISDLADLQIIGQIISVLEGARQPV